MFKPIWSLHFRKVVLKIITMAHGLTEEDLDAQFEQFLKESVSDDSTDVGHDENQQPVFSSEESNQNLNSLWGEDDKISSGTKELALLPVANVTGMGLDTMEEEEEKTRFFAQLEAGASSTVDYSQLNRQLDSSSFSTTGDLRKAEQTAVDHRVTDVVRPLQDSMHHRQYLEDWSDVKEPLEEKPRVSPILAKGESFTQSGESEMEALQEAYVQIHACESSGNLQEDICEEGKGRTSRLTIEVPSSQHALKPPQCAFTESDMSTAEDLMQLIRPKSSGAVDFTLQPVSKPKQKQSGDCGTAARAMDGSGSAHIPRPPSDYNLASSIIEASRDSSGYQHPLSPPLTSVKSELDANLTNELMASVLQTDTSGCQEKAQELQSQKKWKEETAHPQEKPQHVEKDIKEQEMLIKAFQQENEKLYFQLKALQAKSKANEEAMFQANQRLLNELALTRRDRLSKTSWPVGSTLPVNCSGDLLAQVRALQNNEAKLLEELHCLKQEKMALEVDLQLMKKERDLAKAQVVSNTEVKPKEEEITQRKRLQPFAENHRMLETNAGRLKAASTEILQLKERVKELEQTLRDSARKPTSSRVDALLERRVQRLEAELESQNEEAKQSLRALQQQFHLIKGRHEQQISELEQQLEQKQQVKVEDSGMADCRALEEELDRIREYHQEKEKNLLQQIKTLEQQLKTKAQPGPGRHQRQAEAAFGLRIERLNQELATKTRRIQELNHTYEKTYQPAVFTGSHISEVLQENKDLKQCIELLRLHSQEETAALKADAVQAKEELVRLKEHFEERLASLKTEHHRVLDHMRTTALEQSSSKLTELTSKLRTQETDLKHLQDQLKELQKSKEALALSRSREDVLQMQVTSLLQELKKAREEQGPEAKLLSNLEKKILHIEFRHQLREKAQFTMGLCQTSAEQQTEEKRWKCLVLNKNRELETFRLELDSILDILRCLQRQRMTPTLSSGSSS
ncbi:hypothetical protein OJAV_G00155600 [Oryzias javanicus]|uniref:Centrosomal protein of 162 kDa n=1 Tax=Oryzias javanicus TaxID=123683 RepID=A0A437CI14_ORYJA|nr:hypothetical protein OJAV_G00155600 [Oryzias javanicus]